ncbi:MAG: WbqC family protein, partial [Candidatus Margulisbacteria bacterium]|nr:WbqC family protein [Candidatus Margulisiibacteriota bacterium]
INPWGGGMQLYTKQAFQEFGIELFFLKNSASKYKQFNNEFIPNLSIIDVLMFNPKNKILEMLKDYEL